MIKFIIIKPKNREKYFTTQGGEVRLSTDDSIVFHKIKGINVKETGVAKVTGEAQGPSALENIEKARDLMNKINKEIEEAKQGIGESDNKEEAGRLVK